MIEAKGTFKVTRRASGDGAHRTLSEHLDLLMDELVGLDGVLDAAIEADTAGGVVTITVTVEGDDLDDGSKRAVTAIRTAIHAAGGHTSEWDNALVETARQSELVNV